MKDDQSLPEPIQPPRNQDDVPAGRPSSVEELPEYEYAWVRRLSQAKKQETREQILGEGGEIALQYLGQFDQGPRFALLWLRHLSLEISSERLTLGDNSDLAVLAQKTFRGLVDWVQPFLMKWREAQQQGLPVTEFIRESPKSVAALREIGQLVAALRGTSALTLTDMSWATELESFAAALSEMSQRAMGLPANWLRITRDDLLRWADFPDAPQRFPELIRRLIQETAVGLQAIHFPGAGATTSGGWDGMAVATVADLHVPEGVSGWELSVKKNPQSKAESDYKKRTESPDGSRTQDVTYVQAICRQWTKNRSFAREKRGDNRWREVRGYNVEDIEAWLSRAPTTTSWFAEIIGRPVAGVTTSDSWWAAWLASTTIPLGDPVVLAGREAEATNLLERVEDHQLTTIGGEVRIDEIRAFVSAAFHAAQSGGRTVLFLEDKEPARQLLQHPGNLVAFIQSPEYIQGLSIGRGHHVIVAVPGAPEADISLPPLKPEAVAGALQASGLQAKESSDLGTLGRRSLLALRRRLAVHPELHLPAWAAGAATTTQRRALLANTWNQSISGDKEVIAELVGHPYDQIEDDLRQLVAGPEDPLLWLLDERWHVVSPMDAWLLLGPQITKSDIEAFRTLALKVLLEPDPILDLPPDRRWRANLDGVQREYSFDLRRGVARSLALMGALETGEGSASKALAAFARSFVHQVLEKANSDDTSRTWLTLAPHLSLLAEAAPDVFLSALVKALEEGKPLRVDLFQDSERGEFGTPRSSPHTDVLWALENLAWSPQHFDGVVSVLATLTDLDPGGEWSNRPDATLTSLFTPWHPNTSATAEQRLAILNRLRQRNPEVAWNLLVSILPSNHGVQMVHSGPEYREWKRGEPVVTNTEYRNVLQFVNQALLEDVGRDADRWVTLIDDLDHLFTDYRRQVRDQLQAFIAEAPTEGEQVRVWKALRNLTSHHREYSDATWALPEQELDELDELIKQLAPASPLERHAWLFDDGVVTLGDQSRRDDYGAYDAAVDERRAEAVRDIVEAGGIETLMSFLERVKVPAYVGAALAGAYGRTYDDLLREDLDAAEAPRADFAFSYFGARFRTEGWDWVDAYIDTHSELSAGAVARLLRATWDPPEAMSRVERIGGDVAAEYWKNFMYFGLGQEFAQVSTVARRLIDFGRGAAALDLLALYARKSDSSDGYAELVAEAFEALMSAPDDPELKRLSDYDVQTLLKLLAEHRDTLGADRIVKIEWFFLPMLGYDPHAPNLHRHLCESPDFFAQMVSLTFRAEKEEPKELDDQRKHAAENAYRLLSSWSGFPGRDSEGNLDPAALRAWVSRAREILEELGRRTIGDQQIGQALVSVPAGVDGFWPAETVRDLLEELDSDDVDKGLEIAIYNSRGVTSRSLDEGGRQEWNLVKKHREAADASLNKWPRIARIHRDIAASYEREAQREDAEAELRRRGLDY